MGNGNLALQVGGVSDETVKYAYGFWATRTNEWLHCELQTRPLVIEGAATFRQEVICGRKSHNGPRYQDWLTVSRKVTSNFETSGRGHSVLQSDRIK
jgi:hypothetical protein